MALWKAARGILTIPCGCPAKPVTPQKALVMEFAAGVYAKPGVETPIGHVAGTEKELTRWREVIRAGNIAKVMAMDQNIMTEPMELTPKKPGSSSGCWPRAPIGLRCMKGCQTRHRRRAAPDCL